MGIAFNQPVAVFLLEPDNVKIVVNGSARLYFILIDVHIKLHKFIACQEFRKDRQREYISDLLLPQRQAYFISP
ncbi:hypothetical protein D3C75_1277950 [compost metagenome]